MKFTNPLGVKVTWAPLWKSKPRIVKSSGTLRVDNAVAVRLVIRGAGFGVLIRNAPDRLPLVLKQAH